MAKTSTVGRLNNNFLWVRLLSVQKDSRGFTLMELIVVCTLMGIMLVVSVPTMRNSLMGDELRSTSRKIIGFVKGVRELAVREQQAYFLNIDANENRIWHEKDEVGGEKKENKKTEKSERSDRSEDDEDDDEKGVTLPDALKISEIWTKTEGVYSSDQHRIWISKKGYMDQTVLHLTDDESNVISMHFSPFLSEVEVFGEYTPAE